MLSEGGAAGRPLEDPGSRRAARGVLWLEGPSDVMNPASLEAVGVAMAKDGLMLRDCARVVWVVWDVWVECLAGSGAVCVWCRVQNPRLSIKRDKTRDHPQMREGNAKMWVEFNCSDSPIRTTRQAQYAVKGYICTYTRRPLLPLTSCPHYHPHVLLAAVNTGGFH